MRINGLWILPLVFFLLLSACGRDGSVDEEYEPPCSTSIGDGTFEGPYRAAFGFGEGAYAVLRLAFAEPNLFNVVAALGGPVSARAMLIRLESDLNHFDDWPDDLTRGERLSHWRDLFGSFGNPLYENPDSKFYPPGLTEGDFFSYHDKTLPGIVSPENPTGAIPTVSVRDPSGEPIEYLLAHDMNRNGLRDADEPIIMHMHEPFVDDNENGRYDDGEFFFDYGLDGVGSTGDTGENNNLFDENPRIATWLATDPYTLSSGADIDLTPGYRQSIYLDAVLVDPWNFYQQKRKLANSLSELLEQTSVGSDFCIFNRLGKYDSFLSEDPVPTEEIWFDEKFVYMQISDSNENIWDDEQEAQRIGRWSHALSFISLRMPNGLYDNVPKEDPVIWQIRSFFSETMERKVEFGVGYPAGYFDNESSWKVFPVIYVFHDSRSTIRDWYELLQTQGDLAHRELIKQALIILVNGSRAIDDGRGFGYYIDQAAPEIGGNYGEMVRELIDHVEDNFRVQTDYFDRDVDDE